MSTPRAAIQHGSSYLFTDYGLALAVRKFGQAAVDALPKFGPRSKHNGKPKGIVSWRRVTAGGWVRREGRVERRVGQIISAELRVMAAFGKGLESGEVVAQWDADQEAFLKHAAEQEAYKAANELRDRAERWADLHFEAGINEWIAYKIDQRARLDSRD